MHLNLRVSHVLKAFKVEYNIDDNMNNDNNNDNDNINNSSSVYWVNWGEREREKFYTFH